MHRMNRSFEDGFFMHALRSFRLNSQVIYTKNSDLLSHCLIQYRVFISFFSEFAAVAWPYLPNVSGNLIS